MDQKEFRAVHDALAKAAVDQGKLHEAGFLAMRAAIIPPTASEGQISDMRIAYMGGAQHLWSSILSVLEPDSEPTEKDMKRMSLIDAELRAFKAEMELRAARAGGSA